MKKLKTVKRVLNKGSYVTFIMAAKIAIVAFAVNVVSSEEGSRS